MAERLGYLTGPGLSMVRTEAVRILLLIDERERQKEVYDRIRLALVTHDPTQIPAMYPELFPTLKAAMDEMTEKQMDEALDSGAPMEIVTTGFSPSEAMDIMGQISGEDLGMF